MLNCYLPLRLWNLNFLWTGIIVLLYLADEYIQDYEIYRYYAVGMDIAVSKPHRSDLKKKKKKGALHLIHPLNFHENRCSAFLENQVTYLGA